MFLEYLIQIQFDVLFFPNQDGTNVASHGEQLREVA